jgi:SAM-dependent methyltransferase
MIRSILESPTIYRLWQAPFVSQKFRPVLEGSARTRGVRVLDVGCGPGTNARYFHGADYLGVDLDPDYVAYASARFPGTFLARDVNDGIADLGEFDVILMNSLMHHLDDDEVRTLLGRLPPLLAPGGCVVVLDLVMPQDASLARLLARLDRGHHARSYADWLRLLREFVHVDTHSAYGVKLGPIILWNMIYVEGRARV